MATGPSSTPPSCGSPSRTSVPITRAPAARSAAAGLVDAIQRHHRNPQHGTRRRTHGLRAPGIGATDAHDADGTDRVGRTDERADVAGVGHLDEHESDDRPVPNRSGSEPVGRGYECQHRLRRHRRGQPVEHLVAHHQQLGWPPAGHRSTAPHPARLVRLGHDHRARHMTRGERFTDRARPLENDSAERELRRPIRRRSSAILGFCAPSTRVSGAGTIRRRRAPRWPPRRAP